MRRFLIAGLVGIGLIAAACSPTADEPTPDATDYTLYLVRHAEKQGGDDPALTTEGGQRAVDLADRLEEAGIEKIWSSDFRRTRATAEPLAKRLGLDVVIYDANDLASLAEGLKSDGVTALVVGHSNTTHCLIQSLRPRVRTKAKQKSDHTHRTHVKVKTLSPVQTNTEQQPEQALTFCEQLVPIRKHGE